MPAKCERSGSTLIAMPCSDTQLFRRMPMAAILSSTPSPFSGRRTHTPTRSSRRSPVHVEMRQRADDPFFQRRDKDADIRPAMLQVEHYIDHPLARPVIGHLAAAAGLVHRESGIQQFGGRGAGPGGIERRVLDQPDQFGRAAGGDRGNARIHFCQELRRSRSSLGYPPFGGRKTGPGGEVFASWSRVRTTFPTIHGDAWSCLSKLRT